MASSYNDLFLVLEVTRAKVNTIFQIYGNKHVLCRPKQNGSLCQEDMYFELLMLVMNCSEHLAKHLTKLLAR